ncbi:hypothetical protein C2S51_028129 [Perilla frutescens var. frutescens]|nr:hypothetical protein C2S51_028129 [Perilla frutescens var. frutescens]
MESGKNAETLKEGFLESKLSQDGIFRSKIREDGNPGFLSNLSEKCVVDDAYSGRNELSNVELARKFGNGNVEESMVVDGITGNNRMNEGSVSGYSDEKLTVSMHGNDACNDDFPVFQGDLKFSGNDGDQTAKGEELVGKFDDILNYHELFHDKNIEEPVEKGNDVFHPHEPGSPTKLEVSGNSINLFVEVFGPLDGISGSDDNLDHPVECKSEENSFKQEFSLEENETLSTGVTDLSVKCEGEGIIGEQECTFDIGDLVWIKTRTQVWWPGMVCGPSDAPNDMTKCEKMGRYIVKYYGSGHFVPCDIANLKPFPEYFEQMSGQNNSRNFSGSVERALCEIGQRVKLKMTCPCFSKDSQPLDAQLCVRNKEENSTSTQKVSKFDFLSLSQFEPAKFIADIRDLARTIHFPGKVEFMVMKNRLSPFYRSIGHCELPLHLLRSGSDAAQNTQEHLTSGIRDENHNNIFGDGRNSVEAHDGKLTRTRRKRKNVGNVLDDKLTSSAKSLDSRERKKSKYLSYPYTDVIKGQEKEDPKLRGTKKPSKERHIISKADDITACSVELLAELCSSARDCSYISRSKYSDSLERFYCSFRIFAFLDADVASKVSGDQAEAEEQMEGSRVVKKSKKQRANLASVTESVESVEGDKSSVVGNQKAKENVVRRRAKKKKEQVASSDVQMEGISVVKESENQEVNLASGSLENADTLPKIENLQAKENVVSRNTNTEKEKVIPIGLECMQSSFSKGTNIYPKSSWMISFQQACSSLFKSSKTPKKRAGLTPGLADTNSISHAPPGLAGTNSISHTPPGLADTNSISHPPPGLADTNMIFHTPPGLADTNMISHTPPGLADTNSIPRLPDLNGNHPGFPVDHIPVGIPSTNLVNPLPEQRNEGLVSPTINGIHQMDFASVSSSKDVPVTFQNTPLSNNGVSGAYQCLNGDFATRQLDPMTMNTGLSSFSQYSLQMGNFLSAGKPEPKKRKRKEKICQIAPGIPDLNGNVLDMSPSGMSTPEGSHIPPEGEPQKKRRYRSAGGESEIAPGGSLLLNFAPGCVPSNEMLVATFSRFGLLKESELEVLSDDNVKIVYERSSDARFASRSLEKNHTFGESLINFKLDCFIPDPPKTKKKQNLQLQTFVPVGVCKSRTKLGEAPDIAFIKQNVEMMKSTLEKAGDNLSPEMRAKLENEIKAFLDKISSVAGAAPSS